MKKQIIAIIAILSFASIACADSSLVDTGETVSTFAQEEPDDVIAPVPAQDEGSPRVNREPIFNVFTVENTSHAGFGEQFKKAIEYEAAFNEQKMNLSPWKSVQLDVLNGNNVFGWRKSPLMRVVPPSDTVTDIPKISWFYFKAAANSATPQGWLLMMEPRDKQLAQFNSLKIEADQRDVINFKVE